MPEVKIELKFEKAMTRLAGNPYGKRVFDEQVADKINYNAVNIIYIPNNIERIASSFVQGFFTKIIKEVGYEGVKDKIIIDTIHEDLKVNIFKDLY